MARSANGSILKPGNLLRALHEVIVGSGIQWFPAWRVLSAYKSAWVAGDVRAAVNVALLAFPQGMAYAVIAGLPIEYGIYGSIIASIVGPFFSGSRFIMLGPTNATAVLLPVALGALAVTREGKLEWVPLLLIMAGVFLIVGGVFRVATLTQYISRSVVTGYITAAAFYIMLNQVRKVLGIEFVVPLDATLLNVIWLTLGHLGETHVPSLLVGCLTAGVFLLLQRWFKHLPNVALTLVFMSFVGIALNHFLAGYSGATPLQKLPPLMTSQWAPTWPTVNYQALTSLAGPAMVIAFLSLLEGASIGKSLAARSGEKLNTNQEMFGMGMANIACGLGGGMPASGSLTRSKLNHDTGAQSPCASVFCGVICLVGALAIGPLTRYIPTAALGMVVIFIGFSLISRPTIRLITRTTRSDAAVFFTTLMAGLLIRLDFAIVLGAAVSIILFLRKVSSPELVEYSFNEEGQLYEIEDKQTRPSPHISIVHVEGELFFGASELFRDQMRRVCDDDNLKVVILRLKNAYRLDATSAMALQELIQYLKEHNRHLIVSGARRDVYRIFRNSGLIDLVGRENFFMGSASNPNVSTRNALKRAQEVLGDVKAEVKIYYDPNK